MTRAYNPLSVDELGKNAVRALLGYSCEALPPPSQFSGAGVYTIHYNGDFEAYQDIPDGAPIYVGKADPPGRRQGGKAAKQTDAPVLNSRLREHAETIEDAENLALGDFCCRWLVLEPVWIQLTEQVLIGQYRPLWNAVVDGFGNHDPGSGRRNQKRSKWDTLHPGREWATLQADRDETADVIIANVRIHLENQGSTGTRILGF
jgi:hypothetical protein